ncbi:universal stress protein [Salinibius halmophilus]|uniref:universal stress protein n=1 Tax=Salinibius halmophilus TaxID=1853216 RepID=UPI000E660F91|nr:universal stress protein [Salinibius halmophilus]
MSQYVYACIDRSSLHLPVCDYAAWIAQQTGTPLRIQFNAEPAPTTRSLDLSGSIGLSTQAHLLDELASLEAKHQKLAVQAGRALLSSAKVRAQSFGIVEPEIRLRHGDLTEDLLAHEEKIRVLVIGAWGEQHEDDHRLAKRVEVLARAMQVPVLVANQRFSMPKKVAFIFDESDTGQRALNWISTSPVYQDLDILLVKLGEETQAFTEAARALRLAGRLVYPTCLMKGASVEQLVSFMMDKGCDLLALGAFRHNRMHDLLFGSFTMKVLKQANIPVLLLR